MPCDREAEKLRQTYLFHCDLGYRGHAKSFLRAESVELSTYRVSIGDSLPEAGHKESRRFEHTMHEEHAGGLISLQLYRKQYF